MANILIATKIQNWSSKVLLFHLSLFTISAIAFQPIDKKLLLRYFISILFIHFILSCSPTTTPQELFDQNFHPFPNILVDFENEITDSTILVRSFLAYRSKEYQPALDYFKKIPGLTADDPVQLYRGVCHLALGESKKATEFLLPVSVQNAKYRDAANWYLALSALKNKNISETRARLKLLTDRSTYIRNEAKVLLLKLDDLK